MKFGRQYAFSNDLINAYDPTGGSYAFSLLGNSSTLGGGLGDTEMARYNTSIQYVYDYQGIFHAGGMAQLGGFGIGNGSTEAYQFDIGGAFSGFAIDGVYSYDENAIALSTFAPSTKFVGLFPAGYATDTLKGTYGDISSFMLLAKYTYQQFTLSGGYEHSQFSNPSAGDAAWDASNVVTAQGEGYVVNPAVSGSVTTTAYTINKILQVAWVGAKYSVLPNLDLEGGYWYVTQNNYDPTPKTSCVTSYTISGTGKGRGMLPSPARARRRPIARVTKTPSVSSSTIVPSSASTLTRALCTQRSAAVWRAATRRATTPRSPRA